MPRTSLPPTPAPSGDLTGKIDASMPMPDKSFDLPPPAMSQTRTGSLSSNKPILPATGSPNFSLPPPPTRSRTIIHMKPKSQPAQILEKRPSSSSGSKSSTKKAAPNTNNGSKKPPSSTSSAGKKIARKTAHSVIERRRRSKMNEEFGVLKALIPACTDQDMHKLAILQASIDYLRYLESCISDLKAANSSLSTPLLQAKPPTARVEDPLPDENALDEEDDEDGDIAMGNSAGQCSDMTPMLSAEASTSISAFASPHSTTVSPALESRRTSQRSSYTSISSLPSPACGPQHMSSQESRNQPGQARTNPFCTGSYPNLSLSASTSPSIMPGNKEQDDEATSALLMLNKDRRAVAKFGGPKGGRGMSVKDLLST